MKHEEHVPGTTGDPPEKTLGVSRRREEAGMVADLGLGVSSLPVTEVDLTKKESLPVGEPIPGL